MAIENNGSEATYPGPSGKARDTGEGHGSGIEQAESEPKQGASEERAQKKPQDWTPPAGNPGSDQDALANRDNGSARTDTQ